MEHCICPNQTNQCNCLQKHASKEHILFAKLVRHLSCKKLPYTPNGWVNSCYNSDLLQSEIFACEHYRKYTPNHAIVQIVDQSCLSDRTKVRVLPCCVPKNVFQSWNGIRCCFFGNMMYCVFDVKDTSHKA